LKAGHDGGLRRLFPYDRGGWSAVAQDIGGLLRFRLPAGGVRPGLAGLIQGLGLGLVTFQGGVGLAIFLVVPPQGELPATLSFLREWHRILGWGVWGYVGLHLFMALCHVWRRDGVVAAIWPWR
ncbi:MAG: cytochrome b/b6 domain-containing protein, partial [Methylohalobius sp.]|nr:cytochrome b/b6 domain-containing protein [Methylohalobius sp.]